MIRSILVVCAGNLCRSPMAEGLLRAYFPKKAIASVGITAVIGEAADPIAVELLSQRGIDIRNHRAQQLVRWQCAYVDLILTMDRRQKMLIESWYPFVRGKIFRVGEFSDVDIADPYRQGRQDFERALTEIDNGLDQWISKMDAL